MKLKTLTKATLVALMAVALSGCLNFTSILQPATYMPNSTVSVPIQVSTLFDPIGGQPMLGVLLPIGWGVSGNSVSYSGSNSGTINYDAATSSYLTSAYPPPSGYYWWGGLGTGSSSNAGSVSGTLILTTDSQTANFSIDYVAGYYTTIPTPAYTVDEYNANHAITNVIPPLVPAWQKWAAVTLGGLLLFGGFIYLRRLV